MPLDVVRLRDSDLAAIETAEAFRAAVMLWCASWHQVPAASLPDDDKVLAKLAGYGYVVSEWRRVKDGALRGWIKCSDGRLYHEVIAEKANSAYTEKIVYSYGKLCDRLRKAGLSKDQIPCYEAWISSGMMPDIHWKPSSFPPEKKKDSSGNPSEKALKGEGQGKGQPKKRKGAKAPLSADRLPTWMQALVDLYHETLPELPGVRVMDAKREQAMRDFWDWVLTTHKPDGTPRATNEAEALAWAAEYFKRARSNDFIMGRTAKAPEHANWRCSIEFLLSATGMKKVIEETQESA